MRSLLLAACLLLLGHIGYAQAPQIPKTTELTDDASYKKYEQKFLTVEQWLENSPVNKDEQKRKEAATFLLAWLSGVPYVTLEMDAATTPFTQSSGDMVIYYMAGWARYLLQHPADKSNVKGITAGLMSVIKVYKANPGIKRDGEIDKLAKMAYKSTLEAWVAKQLKH